MGLSSSSTHLQGILQKQKNKQYQAACREVFNALHQSNHSDNVGHHPNAFFDQSR